MNKIKMRIIGILLIGLCFCLPIVSFIIQDYTNHNRVGEIDGGKTQEILKKHPLISYLYQYDYIMEDYDEIVQESYNIKKYYSYSKEKQKDLKKIQTIYSQEIQKLIQNKIISHDILETSTKKDYQLTFGTIKKNKKENIGQYFLEQIYRLNSDNDKFIDFNMDGKTHKITSISLTQNHHLDFNQKEIKELLWNMIKYLELDDIDDWNYNQEGYESYQAKLRISFYNEIIDQQQNIRINTSILYLPSPKRFHIFVE
jgi:hypothetical protein